MLLDNASRLLHDVLGQHDQRQRRVDLYRFTVRACLAVKFFELELGRLRLSREDQ